MQRSTVFLRVFRMWNQTIKVALPDIFLVTFCFLLIHIIENAEETILPVAILYNMREYFVLTAQADSLLYKQINK